MNDWAKVAAALLAVSLAGCAATNGGNGNGAAARTVAGSGTMYCMDGKLHAAEGGYRCTWAKTMKEACDATETVVIKSDSIASGPTRGGMCAHGDRIVHVVLK